MSIFQIGSVLFALLMMYIVNIHRKKSRLSPLEVSFWYSVWILFVVIALFPDLLTGVTNILHFSRVFDLLVVIGMMILTLLVISNYFQQKENTQKLNEFVRKEAMKREER